jgi:PAS domain S-box-containing protein
MKFFFRSLNKRLIAFSLLVFGVSLAIVSFYDVRMARIEVLHGAKENIRSYAGVIHAHMQQVMDEGGRCKEIPLIVRVLDVPRKYGALRLIDSEGRVIISSQEEEKGKQFPLPRFPEGEKETLIQTDSPQGEPLFQFWRPFLNEGKCVRCHGEEKKILAYLGVDLSIRYAQEQLKIITRRHILSDFTLLFLISGAMFFFYSRFINRPILEVSRKMTEVEKGNLDARVQVRTQDELGHLASSFNFMVKTLQEMRRTELEQQKLLRRINEDLWQKIQEVNVLYESSRAINQSLQIEEILRMTIENVTKFLGFDRVVLTVFDQKREALVGKWSIGIDQQIVQQVHIPKEDIKGVLYETFTKREPIVVRDTSIYPILDRRGIKKCWEVLECQEKNCPIFHKDELRCWMMEGTRCQREMKQDTFEEKIRLCGQCLYLNQEIINRSDIVNLLLFGSHSFVSVPLIAKEEVLGILLADKRSSQKDVTEEDIKLLMTFISHVSVAIENAILYQKLERKVDLSQKQLEETNEQLKQKVDELNQIQRFTESILQNLYGGIVSYTREGTITFMNQSGAQLLGWEEAEVLGQSIHTVLCGHREKTSIFHVNLDGNGGFTGETEILRKGGEKIPVEVFLSCIRDAEGNLTGVTGIFRDISEKKEIEARMHRMDKLASLGQLASGIAHEIKNPLAGIGSAVQVLASSLRVDARQKEIVEEIINQIHRLDGTLKSLLSFAKPGKPNLIPTNPKEIIDAVVFLISQQIKMQNVEIHLDLKNDLPKIIIDPQQIQQALLNVVLNAVEAMPSGGRLTIAASKRALVGPGKIERLFVSFNISDTGPGIPEGVMAQIFNPFFTTKRSGTGLGLSITQGIVEQHNGRIDIQSEIGKGTSFIIDLPV